METAAYYVALLMLLGAPYILVYWFLLHPLARMWRRLGPALTMVVVHSVMLLLMAVIFLLREPLLRVHFGSSAPLAVFAALFFSGALSLGLLRARRLPVRTLVGMPEFSPGGPGELITAGIYNRIRHPRYVEAFLGVGAAALFSNYLTVYLLWAAYVPAILLVVLLEERELRERFGKPYEKYCRRVPRFVPRVGERVGSRDRAKN